MVFRNLSCLGIIICYINIIGIIPAYACNVLNVCDAFVQILQPLANVHETKWTRHVKRDCDVAVLIIAVDPLTGAVSQNILGKPRSVSPFGGSPNKQNPSGIRDRRWKRHRGILAQLGSMARILTVNN